MKSKFNNNYILIACVAVLITICFLSVNKPIKFDREKNARETVVKKRLLTIRSAEEQYRQKRGPYCNFSTLIRYHYLADSMQYIPFAGKKRFKISVSSTISKSGKQIPLMECGANYRDYLQGMDANEIANLEEKANSDGGFPGLKFGDIVDNNDNDINW